MPFIRKVRVLSKTRLIFPRINGPNVATLRCTKNRRYELSRVTSPFKRFHVEGRRLSKYATCGRVFFFKGEENLRFQANPGGTHYQTLSSLFWYSHFKILS